MTSDKILDIFIRSCLLLAVCGAVHFLLCRVFAGRAQAYKIQPHALPRDGDIQRDFFWSFTSLFVFGCIKLAFVTWLYQQRPFLLFYEVSQSWAEFLITLVAFFILIDTGRYWIHRFLHMPGIYRAVHYVHHKTITPTAFSASSVHPAEITIFMLLPLAILVIYPMHYLVVAIYTWALWSQGIVRHLGYDFFSDHVRNIPLLRSLALGKFHDIHHTDPQTNYASIFTWWDYWAGTVHEKFSPDGPQGEKNGEAESMASNRAY